MTDISPTLQATLDYFSPLSDRVPGQPQTPFKSGREPLPIIFNSTANLDDRYTQLLGWEIYIPELPKHTVKHCTPKMVVNECQCKRFLVPSTCMCKDCIPCAPWVQKRTAESIFRRFSQKQNINKLGGNQRVVCYTVFTIPPHMRERFLDSNEIKKVRKLAWEILKTKFGALFGVEATHPIGSKTTMFHPHLNFVWTQRKGYRSYIDTTLLQKEWANILDVRIADVWHQYSDSNSQIYKWCEYVGRPFPGYTYWKGSIRWYGHYPKAQRKQDYICAECGCYIRRIGTIEASVVADYYAHGWLIGLDPPWYNNKNIILCRGSTKHGTTRHDEGSLLRDEERQLPAEASDGFHRLSPQRSFA